MTPELFVKLLTIMGLVAIMYAMGLRVEIDQVVDSTRKFRLVALSILANFVFVPVATIAVLMWFRADPLVSTGFLILAVCPGAPMGPPFAAIARGNVAFATGLMVLLAALSAVVSPVLLRLLLARLLPASDLNIDYLAIVWTLLIGQVLPLAIGLAMHLGAPKLAQSLAKPVNTVGTVLLLFAIGLMLLREFEGLSMIRARGWAGMVLLLLAYLAIGWLCGGPALATRKSLALTTAVRNAAVALVIVAGNFTNTPATTAVIAFALLSIFGTLGCAFLLAVVREPTK
jgi:BASS family bile acid:Na+ symporter